MLAGCVMLLGLALQPEDSEVVPSAPSRGEASEGVPESDEPEAPPTSQSATPAPQPAVDDEPSPLGAERGEIAVDMHLMFGGEACVSVRGQGGASASACQEPDDLESRIDPRDWPLPFSVMIQFRRIWGF